MRVKSIYSSVFCLLFLLGAFACTKYVAGPQGDPGTPGEAGNLVLSQFSKTIDSLDWSKQEAAWIADIYTEQLTKNVIENGEVKVYLYTENDWWVLPYGKNYVFTQCSIELGKIRMIKEDIHGGVPSRPSKSDYRIVIMTPAE